ncbi:MAG: transglutaminase family protein [Planctomycetaceae bacterium]
MRSRSGVRCLRVLFATLVCWQGADGAAADHASKTKQQRLIRRLIRELDSDRYARRQAATTGLTNIGEPALPLLKKAIKSPSPEVRYRAKVVIHRVLYGDIAKRFAQLAAARKDGDIDLEEGMWLIARIVDGPVKKRDLDRKLDELAAGVRKRLQSQLGKDVDPAKAPADKAIAAIRHVLFASEKFTGATERYDHPANSSLHHVLKTRKGLPILLSHVVVAVARRLKVPIVGIGISGRYMCKYDGSRAPGGPVADVIIDPFGAGRILSAAEFRKEMGFVPDLKPDGHRSALDRMLRNLASDYDHVGNGEMSRLVREYETLLERRSP